MILYTEIDICQEKSPLFPEKKADGRAFSSIRIPSPGKRNAKGACKDLPGVVTYRKEAERQAFPPKIRKETFENETRRMADRRVAQLRHGTDRARKKAFRGNALRHNGPV